VHFAHADLRLLDAELGIDAPRLLDYFLSAEERREWNRLEHSKRKREWLGGRIAAKTAVRMLLDAEIPHIGMRIENGAERAPVVVLERDEDGPAPFIGISHSRDVAVALASTSAGLGIDVEALSSTANELLPQFATADEAESFGKEFDSQNAPTLLWAAKEACRKALGAGSVAATDLRLRDIRSVEGYGLAVFESPRGAVRCAAFLDNGYAWAVARREEAA
jgi:4'-phosphopantetheinyl transferase EntD